MICEAKNRRSILVLAWGASHVALALAIALTAIGSTGCGGGSLPHSPVTAPLTPLAAVPLDTTPTFSILHSFDGQDGEGPVGELILDTSGNLYGTTLKGGAFGFGTVFKLDPTGTLTVLHSFAGTDGANPLGGLALDAAGNLYGTASDGGACNKGTVFKLDATGKETVLHNFTGLDLAVPDGENPRGLVQDASGNLYGTTFEGGRADCQFGLHGCGAVFKVDATGKETLLHSFSFLDGGFPQSGLILDTSGNLYGTTPIGGPVPASVVPCDGSRCGTVFKVDPTGGETVLYSFTGINGDGSFPLGLLVRDAAGNLYGTTNEGGDDNTGTVFKLDSAGNETVLHSLGFQNNLSQPRAGLVRDAVGNLYGDTEGGGAFGFGAVFKLDPTGTLTILHSFNGTDGAGPEAGLIMDAAGNFYGTASEGGSGNCAGGCGTVFKLTP